MLWFISLLFLTLGVHCQEVEQVEQSPIQQFIQKKCYKYSTQGDAYDNLVGLTYDFYKYAEYTATFLPQHLEHFCKNEKPILTLKLKDVNKQLLQCLPKEEKFLPQYVQDTFVDFLRFLCDRDGANVKNFFSSHGKQCREALSQQNASEDLNACFSKVAVLDKDIITRDLVCRQVGLVKTCFDEVLSKYCRDFAAFKELNSQFFKHINKPCSACIFGINNLVVFICVAITLLKSHF